MLLEQKIMAYLNVFRCIHKEQLKRLLPGVKEKALARALICLIKNSGVDYGGPGNMYVLVSKDEIVDYAMIDIIWFLLNHAESEEVFRSAITPSPPLSLCYLMRGILYYIYYANTSQSGLELQKIQEHLDALTAEKERVKVVVVMRDKRLLDTIPNMSFPILCAIPCYGEGNFEAEPEFEIYEVKEEE